jgi:DNA-binding NarL/FixJ family response regulator
MVFWFFKKKRDHEINNIHSMMHNSFSNIKKDIGNISLWVNHFKGKHKEHEDSFDEVIKEINNIKEMFNRHIKENHSEEESPLVVERVQTFKRPVQTFMNVQELKDKMTPSQKNLLNLLRKANIPLDYETIAKELGLNNITVRRHMNDIKRLFDIREMRDVDRGKKVFYIDKEAKITLKRKK